MTLFLLCACLLLIIALAFVLPPLLGLGKAKQDDHKQANIEATQRQLIALDDDAEVGLIAQDEVKIIREETEADLALELANNGNAEAHSSNANSSSAIKQNLTIVAVVLVMIFASVITYLNVGSPQLIGKNLITDNAEAPHGDPANNAESVEQMINNLEQHLASNPSDVNAWVTKGRTMMFLQRYDEAATAFAEANELVKNEPDLLSAHADALVMANQGEFSDAANELITRALALNPKHAQTLWMAGMSAMRQGDFQRAIDMLQRSKQQLTDSNSITQIDRLLELSKQRLNGNESANQSTNSNTATASDAQASNDIQVSVTVQLDEELSNRTQPDDELFVFAKAVDGPPLPLAVSRHKVAELPLTITMDRAMAMVPNMTIADFPRIQITARISKSGEATASSGDLQGSGDALDTSAITLQSTVVINQVVQ